MQRDALPTQAADVCPQTRASAELGSRRTRSRGRDGAAIQIVAGRPCRIAGAGDPLVAKAIAGHHASGQRSDRREANRWPGGADCEAVRGRAVIPRVLAQMRSRSCAC